jgi:hypothetical protein
MKNRNVIQGTVARRPVPFLLRLVPTANTSFSHRMIILPLSARKIGTGFEFRPSFIRVFLNKHCVS